jgi:hypothetical protein
MILPKYFVLLGQQRLRRNWSIFSQVSPYRSPIVVLSELEHCDKRTFNAPLKPLRRLLEGFVQKASLPAAPVNIPSYLLFSLAPHNLHNEYLIWGKIELHCVDHCVCLFPCELLT